MGEVIFKFDSIEEQDDIRIALDGYKWRIAMSDLDERLRSTTKYDVSILKHGENATEMEYEVVDKVREILREILEEYNLTLDY